MAEVEDPVWGHLQIPEELVAFLVVVQEALRLRLVKAVRAAAVAAGHPGQSFLLLPGS